MPRRLFVLVRAGLVCVLGSLLLPAAASAQTGSLTGTVRASDTGQPIAGVGVAAYNAAGTYVGAAFAGADGVYYTTLAPGTYYLVAGGGNLDYETQLYASITYRLGITTVTSGTPVTVTAWQTTTVDFSMRPLGHVSGTVTSAATGAPLARVFVRAVTSDGFDGPGAYTNATGEYRIDGFYSGTYYLKTSNLIGYFDQIYSGIDCPAAGCPNPKTVGTPVQVEVASTRANINFSLASKGYITGTVRDATTGAPLAGVTITATDNAGNFGSGRSDASGTYVATGLAPGSYYLKTLNDLGYLDELYDDLPCVNNSCDVTTGKPVAVTLATPGRADFALAVGGIVTGTITAVIGGAPIAGGYVYAYDAHGDLLRGSTVSDATGRYTINGLFGGTIYLATSVPIPMYFDQLYSGITCLVTCPNVATGTPVTVIPGMTTPAIDFSLRTRPVIAGTVSTASGAMPIANVIVYVYDSQGVTRGSGHTDESGTYTTSTLVPGTYYVRTSNSVGYLDQLYAGFPCVGGNCVVTNGTPIELTFGSSPGISFSLSGGGSISGTVKDTRTSAPLDHYWVQAFTNSGVALYPIVATNGSGQYTFTGLTAGAYYVRAHGDNTYVDQIFSEINCSETCPSVTTGTAVIVSQGLTTSNVNFWLLARGTIAGRVTTAATGEPLSLVTVRIYDASGQLSALAGTDIGGYYVKTGLAPASYFMTTQNGLGYVDQLHSALPCAHGSCVVTTGTAVAVASAGTSTVDFSLQMGAPRVTDVWPWHGPPAGGTPIRLTGEGFVAGATTVTIDGVEATGVAVTSETELTATTPPGTPGEAAMVVGTNIGTVTLARGYTYDPFRRYFAEGAATAFFDCVFALLNPSATKTATVTMRFLTYNGATFTHGLAIPPRTRATLNARDVPGLAPAPGFSTIIESDVEIVADRTMTWDGTGYGSHAETAIAAPAQTWYLAEGATHSGFDLYYVIENPNPDPIDVQIAYLRRAPKPVVTRTYPAIAGYSRTTIYVNGEPDLAWNDVSGVITSLTPDHPIIVERAMYLNNRGTFFNGGTASAGVTTPATDWFLAEGATLNLFDMYIVLANPGDTDGTAALTYMLIDGRTLTKTYPVAANSRQTVWVNGEEGDGVSLANVSLSTMVHADVPIIAERTMWWPMGGPENWYEGHNAVGTTETGTSWALADGEQGGTRNTQTYVLVANTSPFAGRVRVTLLGEDGSNPWTEIDVPANSRTTVWMGGTEVGAGTPFGGVADGKRFGSVVESLPCVGGVARIVVERAMYSDADGVWWAAGTGAVATKVR